MTHAGYVFAGYAVTAAVLAAYAAWIISRRRALLRQSGIAPGTVTAPATSGAPPGGAAAGGAAASTLPASGASASAAAPPGERPDAGES